jgi:hypothetical protein
MVLMHGRPASMPLAPALQRVLNQFGVAAFYVDRSPAASRTGLDQTVLDRGQHARWVPGAAPERAIASICHRRMASRAAARCRFLAIRVYGEIPPRRRSFSLHVPYYLSCNLRRRGYHRRADAHLWRRRQLTRATRLIGAISEDQSAYRGRSIGRALRLGLAGHDGRLILIANAQNALAATRC